MIAPLAGVNLRHTTLIATVIGCDVMLLLTRTEAVPDISDGLVRERITSATRGSLRDVCHY